MLVGRYHHHPDVRLPVETPIEVVPEPSNACDANAHMVKALVDDQWLHVGYIERGIAALLSTVDVAGAHLLVGGGGNLPVSVAVA